MSKRNQKIKRRRYYRRMPAKLDWMAVRLGLEICGYLGICDFCETAEELQARCWARMSRGEVTEMDEAVCANCLPDYYRDEMANRNQENTRAWERWWRNYLRHDNWEQRAWLEIKRST